MSPSLLLVLGLLGSSPPCPGAMAQAPATLSTAGDLLTKEAMSGRLAQPQMTARLEEAFACYRAAYVSPPAVRPAEACQRVARGLSYLRRTEATAQRRICAEEATTHEERVSAWASLGQQKGSPAETMSYLLEPNPNALWRMTHYSDFSATHWLSVQETRWHATGRPEIPLLIAARYASQDSLREWLVLWAPVLSEPSRTTALPVAYRKPGVCSACRTWDMVDGRMHLRAVPEAGSGGARLARTWWRPRATSRWSPSWRSP